MLHQCIRLCAVLTLYNIFSSRGPGLGLAAQAETQSIMNAQPNVNGTRHPLSTAEGGDHKRIRQ